MPSRVAQKIALTLGVCIALAAPAANAAQLVLDCQVQANRADNGVTRWRRRIVLTSADHMARYFDDVGDGFRPKSAHRFVSVTRDRVVLDAAGAKQSFVDRRTGAYVLRNTAAHFELRGVCKRGAPGPAERRLF